MNHSLLSTSVHSPQSNTTLQNEFTSSSNTLCNYPFVDESLTLRLRQQHQASTGKYLPKSSSVKINTISYPSLNRTNIENINKINQSKFLN